MSDVPYLWPTRVVERARGERLGPLAASLVTLGLPPAATTAAVLTLARTPSRAFVVGHLLAASIAVFGPYLVWRYDTRTFPEFFTLAEAVVDDDATGRLAGLEERHLRLFRRYAPVAVVPWTAVVLGVFSANPAYFATQGLPPGSAGYWLYALFFLNWGLLTGVGFHAVPVMVLAVDRVASLPLDIDPLHPDGLGGLSAVGTVAVRTTAFISIGSLALPLAFDIGARGRGTGVVVVAVVAYVGVILLAFAVPTLRVNRRASRAREAVLESYRERIRDLESQVAPEAGTTEELSRQLEIQRVRRAYREYDEVSLYPLSVSIVSRLLSSILLPLAFMVLELFLPSLV
jgi:hypothetical protein